MAADALTPRPLGRSGLRLSPLGFGCASIASLGTRHSPAEVQATLRLAVARGLRFFDTADVYGQGDSERLLGRLIADSGVPLVVCSKVGLRLAQSQLAIRLAKPLLGPLLRRWAGARARSTALRRASERHDFAPATLRQRVHASLRRLGLARLDLLLLHSPPVALAERDELLALLQRLQQSGEIGAYGVSAAQLGDAAHWAHWPGLACLQLPLTPVPSPAPGSDPATGPRPGAHLVGDHGAGPLRLALPAPTLALLAGLQARGIGVVAREVYGAGRLASTAQQRAQALAAVLAAPAVASALVGMGCRAHLADNLLALDQAAA